MAFKRDKGKRNASLVKQGKSDKTNQDEQEYEELESVIEESDVQVASGHQTSFEKSANKSTIGSKETVQGNHCQKYLSEFFSFYLFSFEFISSFMENKDI